MVSHHNMVLPENGDTRGGPPRPRRHWGQSPRHCVWTTQFLSNKCRCGGEQLATLCPILPARNLNLSPPAPETNALSLDQLAGQIRKLVQSTRSNTTYFTTDALFTQTLPRTDGLIQVDENSHQIICLKI